MALTLNDIETLFQQRGHEQYSGEPVTQLQHALQSAYLGEQEGASDELLTAAFLHDLAKQPETQTPELYHYMQIARRCALRA
jgi:predicted HD phosphohydrolase